MATARRLVREARENCKAVNLGNDCYEMPNKKEILAQIDKAVKFMTTSNLLGTSEIDIDPLFWKASLHHEAGLIHLYDGSTVEGEKEFLEEENLLKRVMSSEHHRHGDDARATSLMVEMHVDWAQLIHNCADEKDVRALTFARDK
jgi:hypothetical protein